MGNGTSIDKIGKYQEKHKRIWFGIIILLLIIFCALLRRVYIRVKVEDVMFTESARELKNPNRGFYHLYTFWITEEETNYEELIDRMYYDDTDTELTLVKICLQNYRGDAISEKGIENIKKLFRALGTLDNQMLVRFIYDDEGRNEEYEPENLDIILQHMKQLEPVFSEHSEQIFIIQGLFIGNWGEMNGTRYNTPEDMGRLARQLASVTDESIYLSVRTPAQWRSIIQSNYPSKERLSDNALAARLSLFNDGLLGSQSDYGTYKLESNDQIDPLGRWNREEELEFQGELCRYVPNGGEVIVDNPCNDFENAIEGLAERHITYINKDYDQAVFKKWEKETVTEEGCFEGMDGYTYIDRHLGYRLLIADTNLEYQKKQRCISVEVLLKNVGFAPLYKEPEIHMVLHDKENDELISKEMLCDVRELAGGEESERLQAAYSSINVNELSKSDYTVYFFIEDSDTGKHILLANEQDEEEYGYRIGTVRLFRFS